MFQGFTPQTQDFLWALAFNNERSWFQAHKEEFETCLKNPFHALAKEVLDGFNEMRPDIDWQVHITRIYRDARRLFGRGPYKDHLWFNVKESGSDVITAPNFWFSIERDGYGFGMGVFQPTAADRERYRAAVDAQPALFESYAKEFEKQELFKMRGESYAKAKGNYEEPLKSWYNIKSFAMACDRPYGPELYDSSLKNMLLDGYKSLMPYFDLFRKHLGGVPEDTK